MLSTLLPLIVSGLAIGSIYALIAFGFVLLLKATATLSFTQLQFITLGGYLTFSFTAYANLPFYIAVAITGVVAFVLGALLYKVVIKPMAGQPHFSIVVATIGVSIMIKSVVGSVWGYQAQAFPLPFANLPLSISPGVMVSLIDILVFSITLLLVFGFILFFNYTLLGTQMRAVADDEEGAHTIGINVSKVFIISWGIAALSASIAGVFLAGIEALNVNLGDIALKAFPVVILGGAESIPGAIVGGLIIGVFEVLAGWYLGQQFRVVAVFFILLLLLMVRPFGLFGERKVERV